MHKGHQVRRLSAPPRWVSPRIAFSLLFGQSMGHFAWLFVHASLVFTGIFGVFGTLKGYLALGQEFPVDAVVTAVSDTAIEMAGSAVYAVDFKFELDGESYTGVSYSADPAVDVGEGVMALVIEKDPDTATIPGMRRGASTPFIMFVMLLFPFAGLMLAMKSLVIGARQYWLLVRGVIVWGEFHAAIDTGGRVNDVPVMRYEYAFEYEGRTYFASGSTHRPESIRDDASEPILFSPNSPDGGFPFDLLRETVRLDDRGRIRPRNLRVGFAALWPCSFALWMAAVFF